MKWTRDNIVGVEFKVHGNSRYVFRTTGHENPELIVVQWHGRYGLHSANYTVIEALELFNTNIWQPILNTQNQ